MELSFAEISFQIAPWSDLKSPDCLSEKLTWLTFAARIIGAIMRSSL